MLLQDALKSRVGQQLFLRFVLVAVFSILLMAGLAYLKVSGLLVGAADQQLQQASKAFGVSVVDRLNLQSALLRHFAELYPAPHPAVGQSLKSLTLASAAELARLRSNAIQRLGRGDAVLQFGGREPSAVHLLIRQPETHQILSAGLNAGLLWRNAMSPENFCVFTQQLRRLYCSPSLRGSAVGKALPVLSDHGNGVFQFSFRGTRFMAGYWNVGLEAVLGNPGMVVVVARKRADVMAPLEFFQRFYFALAVLVLGITSWVALTQIRRQLRPLNQLLAGTQGLAEGNFDARIDVRGGDEFGQLGAAFNTMAESLNDKFRMQEAFATLDRAVLSAAIIDDVIRVMLDHLPAVLRAESVAIAYFVDEQRCTLYTPERMVGVVGQEARDYVALAERIDPESWLLLDRHDSAVRRCLDLSGIPASCEVLGIGIYHNARCVGVLLFGFRQLPVALAETVLVARGFVERLSVAAARLTAEEALRYQAHHDALTDLPNRSLLRDRAEQAIERSSRNATVTALMLADLDKFKRINDSLGHAAGDTLLQACARRLTGQVRASDTVARLGGDEYVILLPDMARETAVDKVGELARTFNRLLAEPVEIGGRQVSTQASIGIALYPDDAGHFDDLLRMADAAMYEAKRNPRAGLQWCSQSMNAEVNERFDLTQELRTAIDNDEMLLYYQPKVALDDGRICGAEALVRWQSPSRGLVPPNVFVPLLEEMGLGEVLGEWVIGRACEQMADWDGQGLPPIPVAVNLATSQLLDAGLCNTIGECLFRYDLRPQRLEIEILEAAVVSQTPIVGENLSVLREMGVSIALDDFGTGYSSLSYLTDLPASVLKLDRSFIQRLVEDARQQAIVERIIALAKTLGLNVVAEGVEEETQRAILKRMGCDSYQGYLYSRPCPPSEFESLLRAEADRV
ncbi:MAG: EAL domain-containing protein [Acidihalobacter sp.]